MKIVENKGKNIFFRVLVWIVPLLLVCGSAEAQQRFIKYFRVQSGTGFFVNREYVITNAHVVKGCSEVIIKGAVPEHKAEVSVMDAENDLALLRTEVSPQQFAPLRFNIDDLKTGDKVLLMGYPGEAGARGEYAVATAQIEDMHQLVGSQGRFFITDVVEHGNSGGPVFDTSGNVIGVVVAKSVLYTVNTSTNEKIAERHVGVVISLATLKQFLFDHGIFTEWLGSSLLYADSYIEDNAKAYIVNVQCRMPTDGSSSQNEPAQQGVVTYDR
jgi:S1-C subfamily serine protease